MLPFSLLVQELSMTKRVLGVGLALALGVTLTACGGGTTQSSTTSPASSPAATTGATTAAGSATSPAAADEHNAVDVMFATMMIPHHQGAIEMSDLALSQASTAPVKDLAARIKAAQGPEIELMQSRLDQWGAAVPMSGASEDMGHGMAHGTSTTIETTVDDFGMGGMMSMSEADLAALQAASGVDFDTLFLQQMIVHHQGAIDMAEVEIAQGRNPQTLALAEAIKAAQTAEIAEMQQLQSTL
jgi:uncharacterized protein (DUF305 family)